MILQLLEYLSANNSIANNIPLINFEGKNKNYITNILINYDETKKIIKNPINIFKIWNIIDIGKILYEKYEVIYINDIIIDFPINFYLTLLIQNDRDKINFSYSFQYLKKNIEQILSNSNKEYYILIVSKIFLILLDNYTNDCYNPSYREETCKDMENKIKEILNNNVIYQNFDFKHQNIEEIYSKIIKDLIIKNKFEKYEETIEIVEQIALKNIDITKNIFDDIIKLFEDEKNREKYLISEEMDFTDKNKINFYYLFLKYVFKSSIYIYNFDLFLKTRKFLIDKINSGYSIKSIILSEDKNIKRKGKFIIETLLDLDYYIEKLKNNTDIKFNKEQSLLSTESESHSIESFEKSSENLSFKITNKNSNLKKSANLYLKCSFIKETQNLYPLNNKKSKSFIFGTKKTNLIKLIKKVNIDDKKLNLIKVINSGYLFYDTFNQSLYIYDKNFYEVDKIDMKGEIFNNITVTEKSKEEFSIITCFPDKLKLYDFNNNILISKIEDFNYRDKEDKMNFIYQIKENLWLICYKKKIYFTTNIVKGIFIRKINIPSIVSAIKINKNYIALKSCSSTDINNNKILFFNISNLNLSPFVVEGYSLILFNGGLTVIPDSTSLCKNKVLLCACKKYSNNDKNGILLINTINLEGENKNKNTFFYNTKDFEVYCICPILFNYNDLNYFFVGGFDSKRKIGYIKLFTIKFDNLFYQNNIGFIKDLDNIKEFESPIVHIILDKNYARKNNILVNCMNGDIYLFSGPNIGFHLKIDEEIRGEVSCVDFFNENN